MPSRWVNGPLGKKGDWRLNRDVLKRVVLLSSIGGLLQAAISATRPLISLRAHELGASPTLIGLIVSVYAILPLFMAIPMGIQVDRTGARRFLIIGSIGMALSLMMVVIVPSYVGLILAQLGTGFSFLAIVISCQTSVSRLGGPADRERTLGLFSTFISAGMLIGPVLGGYAADAAGYGATFGMAALFSLITVALVMTLRATAEGTALREQRNAGEPVTVLSLLRNPTMIIASVSAFAQLFALGAWEAFFPIWMQEQGHSVTVTGTILSIQALASLLIRIGLKSFVAWIGGRFRLLITGMAVGGIAVGLVPVTPNIILIGVVAMFAGASSGLVFPLGIIAVAAGTTDRERGLGMGLRLTSNRLASLINPLLFGLIATAGGLSAAFFAGSAVLLAVTASILPFSRAFPDTEPAPTVHD